jgi:hypothetical protein
VHLSKNTDPRFLSRIPSIDKIRGYYKFAVDLCTIEQWIELFDAPVAFTLEVFSLLSTLCSLISALCSPLCLLLSFSLSLPVCLSPV